MTDKTEDRVFNQLKRVLRENLMMEARIVDALRPSDDLFDVPYNLQGRDLAYVVVLLEEIFNQNVTAHDILHGKLSAVEGLMAAFSHSSG